MGADFLCQYAYLKKGDQPDWAAGETFIRELFHTPRSEWDDLPSMKGVIMEDFIFHLDVADCEDPSNPDPEEDMRVRKEVCERLEQSLTAAKDLCEDLPRDCSWIHVGEYQVLITGGLSTGDTPTESFDVLHDFVVSELAEKVGFSI